MDKNKRKNKLIQYLFDNNLIPVIDHKIISYGFAMKCKNTNYIQSVIKKATFKIVKVKSSGVIEMTCDESGKIYSLLLDYPLYKYMEVGDYIRCRIFKRLFYVYWEIDQVIDYYPAENEKENQEEQSVN